MPGLRVDVLDATISAAIDRVMLDARSLDSFPHVTREGAWMTSEHGRWTAGFFVGEIWLSYFVRRVPEAKSLALAWSRRLLPRAIDTSTHDMGFLFEPSYVRGFKITGDDALARTALLAARSLATRFRRVGEYIPAWEAEEDPSYTNLSIVDTVMNLPILAWAGRYSGDAPLAAVATVTAETIRRQHIRGDATTIHTVDHDAATGWPTTPGTHQGASPDSTWSRGQAWALHGFTRMAGITGQRRDIHTATSLAERYLSMTGTDPIPPWDFSRAGALEPRDSAAAAIAASGLLELAWLTHEPEFQQAGTIILAALAERAAVRDPDIRGILTHGAVDVPRGSGIDTSIIYGDHFYLEALIKLRYGEEAMGLGAVDWVSN